VAMTNDVVGWILLGALVSVAESGSVSVLDLVVAVAGMVLISLVVLGLGSRFLDRALVFTRAHDGGPAASASIIVLFTVAVGAATHALGLEVVIGAFLAGIAIGRSRLSIEPVMDHLELVTAAVFAPLFFGVAGLRVDLRALGNREVLIGAIVITLVATFGKLSGAYAGARWGGLAWPDAFGASAALNARGALEVVVATVGLTIGVLSDASYTAIVLMAIITSASAGPLLRIGAERRV
jgi:Kef-type K+ transport system membrane component KefB